MTDDPREAQARVLEELAREHHQVVDGGDGSAWVVKVMREIDALDAGAAALREQRELGWLDRIWERVRASQMQERAPETRGFTPAETREPQDDEKNRPNWACGQFVAKATAATYCATCGLHVSLHDRPLRGSFTDADLKAAGQDWGDDPAPPEDDQVMKLRTASEVVGTLNSQGPLVESPRTPEEARTDQARDALLDAIEDCDLPLASEAEDTLLRPAIDALIAAVRAEADPSPSLLEEKRSERSVAPDQPQQSISTADQAATTTEPERWQPTPIPAGDGRHDIGDDVRTAIFHRLHDDFTLAAPWMTAEQRRQLAMLAAASVRALLHELGTLRDLAE